MKIKPHRPRSCLGWLGWVFASLLILFALSYAIDMIRLTNAWNEAYALAAQLGYTPERHLTDRAPSDINIVPVFGACEVKVFFTTQLDPADFAAHLAQAVSPLADGSPTNGLNMYVTLYPTVDGRPTDTLPRDQIEKLPPVYEHSWLVMDEDNQIKIKVFYSEFSQANVKIEYGNQRITENVAYVGVEAGKFPIWTFVTDICVRSRDLQRWMRR